jgi:hypothetical protein
VRWLPLSLVAIGCAATTLDPAEPRARAARSETSAAPAPTIRGEAPRAAVPFGEGYPLPLAPAPHGRVGSLTWGTWIKPKPSWGALPLGGIRPGTTLPLSSARRVKAVGACAEWVEVERGFVCGTKRATLAESSPWIEANRWTEPIAGAYPYEYALSVGAPMLTRPVPADQFVWSIGRRDAPPMRGWNAGHDELAESEPIAPNGELPPFLADGKSAPTPWGAARGLYVKQVPFGTMIAYTRAFEAYGETWVLSSNLTVIPARGLKRFRRSTFRGVELGGGIELPIGWARKQPIAKWRKTDAGFAPAGELTPRTFVALTGAAERDGKRRLMETRDPGIWVERDGLAVVERVAAPPEARGKHWIHVRVNRGTLTLYEGSRPVFATLMSPGKQDATPYGRYFVESKYHVTTMTTELGEPKKPWIAQVPWTIYFKRPYAIHGAYWHEDFGERKSGGCINLSPIDAERVFRWTQPELPAGWTSVQAYGNGGGPFVLVEG